ncbi:hypothetical protein LSAT2_015504 [Lamellibrachia satsuma]|nr:hypothetical protein LSAT2_015504 [Lamellibrachia satsuma]
MDVSCASISMTKFSATRRASNVYLSRDWVDRRRNVTRLSNHTVVLSTVDIPQVTSTGVVCHAASVFHRGGSFVGELFCSANDNNDDDNNRNINSSFILFPCLRVQL